MTTKKELIAEYRQIKHDNFELLWSRMNGSDNAEKAFYFLNLKTYNLKYWTKLKIYSLIVNLKNYIKFNF